MTKAFLLALGVSLPLPTLLATLPLPTTPAQEAAPMVPLNLSQYGAPLVLQVPAGAKAKLVKGSYGPPTIDIEAPRFHIVVAMFSPPTTSAKDKIDSEAQNVGDDNKVVLREPLLFRTKSTLENGEDGFGVALDNPATKYTYYIRPEPSMTEHFSVQDVDVMLASARSAKLLAAGAAPAKAPVRKPAH